MVLNAQYRIKGAYPLFDVQNLADDEGGLFTYFGTLKTQLVHGR